MTVSLAEFIGGVGMIGMVFCLGINVIMYFNCETENQKNTTLIMGVFNTVALLAFTGLWLVGQ